MYIFKIRWAISLNCKQLNSNQLKLKGKQGWSIALLVKYLRVWVHRQSMCENKLGLVASICDLNTGKVETEDTWGSVASLS